MPPQIKHQSQSVSHHFWNSCSQKFRINPFLADSCQPKPAFICLVRAVSQFLRRFIFFPQPSQVVLIADYLATQLLPTVSWPSDELFRRFFVDPQTSRLSDQLFRR